MHMEPSGDNLSVSLTYDVALRDADLINAREIHGADIATGAYAYKQ